MESLGAATTQFGFDLFKELSKRNSGNVFFSPASISTAIGMLLLGARGATAAQLQKVLFSEKDTENSRTKAEEKEVIEKTEEIHHQFQMLLSELSKLNNYYELKIANRLFGEKTYLFLQKYLDYVEKYYNASLEPVDFINAADESRKKINSWVESQTHEKIKDLFPDATLSSSTKLVLVNVVSFKGQWDRAFKKEHTKEEAFWLDKGTSKPVMMMAQRRSCSFALLEDLQAKLLGIPYKNGDLSMFLLLPDDVDGLEEMINKISPEELVEWTSPGQLEDRPVDLRLPRFEVEDSYDLEAALAALGLGGAFSERGADYSGMSPHSGLHAQKFLHRSFVAVTEEGTEAAAATGAGFGVTSVPGHETFHCDHPFLFFIRHNGSDSIIFFGRFFSP
ncbi:PREDICTED: serpin B13 isoform X2 [Miniopterus natalensis]|uniref:serpin B13 isoform X2 n=1 Tax=Miniopterus natalensis TaxID=291302 RepID=UPI0007A6E33D|nr:PREDICTED: serpin B13 isoform X2 [Miniopterus natalensis]